MSNIIPVDFTRNDSEEGDKLFRIQFVALAYASAVQLGETELAKRLLKAINGSGFDTAVALDAESERWVENKFDPAAALFYDEEAVAEK